MKLLISIISSLINIVEQLFLFTFFSHFPVGSRDRSAQVRAHCDKGIVYEKPST